MKNPNTLLPGAVLTVLALALGTSACTDGHTNRAATAQHNVATKPATWDTEYLQTQLESDINQQCQMSESTEETLAPTQAAKQQQWYAAYRRFAQKMLDDGQGWFRPQQGDQLPEQVTDLTEFC